jgi:phosphocarrier protein
MAPLAEPEVRRTITIRNSRGLHARAAGKLVRAASQHDAEIWVMRADMVVSADSIMGLMMLSAGPGTEIELWARGPEANEAMAALVQLIERGFDEDTNGQATS